MNSSRQRRSIRPTSWSSRHDHVCYNLSMKKIAAGEFKARCLSLMEDVRSTRVPLIITKRGKPVAKVVPADMTTIRTILLGGWKELYGSWAILSPPSRAGNRRDPARFPRSGVGSGGLQAAFTGSRIGNPSRSPERWVGDLCDHALGVVLASVSWKDSVLRHD